MQYQDVEATDQLPCLAKYLTRHSTHEKEILKDLSMAFETQKPMDRSLSILMSALVTCLNCKGTLRLRRSLRLEGGI